MKQYIVSIHFATWAGNVASCRRTVWALDHSHALDLIAARVRKWKRFMGRLDMDCTEVRP